MPNHLYDKGCEGNIKTNFKRSVSECVTDDKT